MRPLALLTGLLLLAGAAAGGVAACRRASGLKGPREVAVVLDYAACLVLAGKLGYEPLDLIESIAGGGASALGISEVSLDDLRYRPGISVLQGHELLAELAGEADSLRSQGLLEPWYTYILTGDRTFAAFLGEWAGRHLGPGRSEVADLPGGLHAVVLRGVPTAERADPRHPETPRLEPTLRFGFWPGDLAAARELDLDAVAVLRQEVHLSPEDLRALLSPVAEEGVGTAMLAVREVPGHPTRSGETADLFRELGLLPAVVKGASPKGFESLFAALDYRGLKFTEFRQDRPLADYADAVRERHVRGVYFVPALFPGPAPATVEGNRSQLADLAAALTRAGHPPGQVHPAEYHETHPALLALIGAGVGAAAFALASLLAGYWGRPLPGGAGLAAAAGVLAAVAVLWPGAGREGLAWLAAIVFPAGAVLVAVEGHRRWRSPRPSRTALGWALSATVLAVAGGLLIVGLLGDGSYILEARLFRGVKAAHALPPVIVAGALLAGRMGALSRRSLTAGEFALALGLAVAAVLYVVRTGNQPVVAPTEYELELRAVLEQWLPVRPRFKEFLVGHPALFLLPLGVRAGPAWTAALALLATVGQVSVVNSFAHLHVPLELSLIRTGLGLLLGLALGLAAMGVLARLIRKGVGS
ncbi:MAG: DUF5693 family protein [bacterium]|nr:DUF5693 family protein [bacterium]